MNKRFISIIITAVILSQVFIPVAAAEVNEAPMEFHPLVTDGLNCYYEDFEIPQYSVSSSKRPLKAQRIIPEAFDLRDMNAVTPVKDQGETGCCWAFSAVSSLESNAILQGFSDVGNTDFSEAHLAWFSKNPVSSNPEDADCLDGVNNSAPYSSGGNALQAVAALARRSGIADESDYPFYGYNISAMGNYSESDRHNTGSGFIIKSANTFTGSSSVKSAIMSSGAVMASYYHINSCFNETSSAYYYPYSRENETEKINHAITIIGWDDSYSAANFVDGSLPTSDGAWLCKNSWGTAWGDGGFFWISYEDKTLADFYGFNLTREEEFDYNYTYNGMSHPGCLSLPGSATQANLYTAKHNESIKAVSFWVMQTGLTGELKIYTDVPPSGSPFSSNLVCSYSFVTDNTGYLTFDLEEAVSVNRGERFMAAITLTAPDETGVVCIPFESSDAEYVSNPRESFLLVPKLFSGHMDTYYNGQVSNAYVNVLTVCNHSMAEQHRTESTCCEQGKIRTKCTQCGKETVELLPLEEHNFGEWETVFEPTAANEGLYRRVCGRCGFCETETQPKLPSNGYKTIYIDDLIDMIFARIYEILADFLKLTQ